FQRLGHQGVIGIPQGCLSNLPGLLPGQVLFVYKHTHQFRDCHCRMGVIELNSDLGREGSEAGMALQISFDNVPVVSCDNLTLPRQGRVTTPTSTRYGWLTWLPEPGSDAKPVPHA